MEHELIRWLAERVRPHPQVPLGIGDDAALLRFSPECQTVATTDMLMDGVDFVLASDAPQRIGRKALAVNLSDLAAMAAKPVAALVSLALPRAGRGGEGALALAQQLYEGMLPLAEEFGLALAGGDTNVWEGPLVLSITALGDVAPGKAFLRSGGQPGDELLVTGSLGGSRIAKQFNFTPRIREALRLAQIAAVHAAQDLSDGLLLDLSRLAAASGCGAELHLAQIPVSPAAVEWSFRSNSGKSPLEHACSDGEDFELLLALPPADAERLLREQPLAAPLTRIGRLTAEPGLFGITADGTRTPLAPQGYLHA